jgi:chromosome segregation ATPase
LPTSCAAGLPSYASYAGLSKALDSLLFPPALIKRALDDLHAIGDAARRVDGIQRALLSRLDVLAAQVERLREEMVPLKQLPGVRSHLQAVRTAVEPVVPRLELLRDEVRPIQEMSAVRSHLEAVRAAVEPLGEKLGQLREEIEPIGQLADVRAGIEPLDDDMRQVRESIDEIEPLVKGIGSHMRGLDEKLARMSGDLAPVGDLAEKMPGVKRR